VSQPAHSRDDGGRPPGPDLVDRYDAALLDLDGVLYRGTEPIDGAAEAVRELRERGVGIAFVTNNSSRTPEQVAEKLRGLGIDARPEEVASSAMATADFLAAQSVGSAFVVGETGIREALRKAGIEVLDGEPDHADVVVVGVDTDATYATLRTAALLVQRGSRLVATNADRSYPVPEGLWPGAGALLAVITTTTGREPEAVIGKPNTPLLEAALERAGGSRPLVVGDRLDTDISGAAAAGWDSLLVLTGVSGPADLVGARDLPTYVAGTLGGLFRPPVDVRPAGRPDAAPVTGLLREAGLATDGVDDRIGETLVAEGRGSVVGTAALELFDPGTPTRSDASDRYDRSDADAKSADSVTPGRLAHLRSLAVAPDHRGSLVGSLLVARAVALAVDLGAREVHVVTDTAAGFFEGLGFERAGSRDSLPAPILATRMVRESCSASSVALRWRVPSGPADAAPPR
jgi:glycerol-1-phosphatase